MSLNCDSQQLQWRAPAVDSDYAAFGHMILLFFFFVIVTNYRALGNKPVLLQDTPAQFDVANRGPDKIRVYAELGINTYPYQTGYKAIDISVC